MNSSSLPFTIHIFHPRAVLIQWDQLPSASLLQEMSSFKNVLERKFKGKCRITIAYQSLLIQFKTDLNSIDRLKKQLFKLYNSRDLTPAPISKHWIIPVCYEKIFAFDLSLVSEQLNLGEEEIIELHTQGEYLVYFVGFLPGFLYLLGLDSRLQLPRKSEPILQVPSGSVAIGGNQTGIYPSTSPGGWHVIGQTPISLFKPSQKPHCFAHSGDTLSFKSISKEEFLTIQKQIEQNKFSLEKYD
ncbi:MAG: 5-oxoprolinase subunit PxpB [Flavobacteriaceae bacterium]